MKNIHHYLFVFCLCFIGILMGLSPEFRHLVLTNTQIDTIGHFISFFCLTWILCSFIKLPTLSVSLCLILYALLSELGQYYLGYRNGEVKDFVADVLGILFFVILKWYAVVYLKRKPS